MGGGSGSRPAESTVRLEGVVEQEYAGVRLDVYLSKALAGSSRSAISARVSSVSVNGAAARLSRKVAAGDRVVCRLKAPETREIVPEPIELDVLYENDDVVVVNKPAGFVVHPANGNWSGTLVHALLYRYPDLESRFGTRERPGIVHRLDKDTSGVLIVAKNPDAHFHLARQFERRKVLKRYVALVRGSPPASVGSVEGFIRRDPHNRKRFAWSDSTGKPSKTEYRVLARFERRSLVALAPKTGRTHQLRVHMQHCNCPIVGDEVYGRRDSLGLMLHAALLSITLPGEASVRTFTAPLPERIRSALSECASPEAFEAQRWYDVLREW